MKIAKDDGGRTCTLCGGDGYRPVRTGGGGEDGVGYSSQECPVCVGTGLEPFGPSFYPEDIYPTYKIVEATVAGEYAALSDANKDLYKMILSCGVVDLSAGTSVRNYLLSMFGAGTTTRANLVTLVS